MLNNRYGIIKPIWNFMSLIPFTVVCKNGFPSAWKLQYIKLYGTKPRDEAFDRNIT